MRKRYTIQLHPARRGTAGAASQIPAWRTAMTSIGGKLLDYYIMGPILLLHVEMDSSHYGELLTWSHVADIRLNISQPGA